jgi:aspartyl/asparaginyl beta-hydroxylase (cupin superfamily)
MSACGTFSGQAMRLLKAARPVLWLAPGWVSAPTVGASFVSKTLAYLFIGRALSGRVWKYTVRRVLFPLCVLAPFAYFFPKIALFYAVCGAYDVGRNSGLNLSTLRRYFIGNGFPTWVMSPLNILLDLLSLPYVNKGVYQLGDLPSAYQDEVKRLTIGVSVFNKKISTSLHFGSMRASLRILYNLNEMNDDSAYIVVGDTTSYWRENKLFIFDDTLLHQSFNETDQTRYCLFVDIVRPTPFPGVMRAMISGVHFLTQSFKFIYYQNWKVIER